MTVVLLLAGLVAAEPSYHEQALRRLTGAPRSGVADLRRQGRLAARDRERLAEVVESYRKADLGLRIVLVDAGPSFSLGDFTTRAWRLLGGGAQEVLIVTSSTGVHAQAPWTSYGEARRLARSLRGRFDADPVDAISALAERVLEDARRRARHRRIMVGVAALAGLGLAGVVGAALRRRRRRGREAPTA